MHPQRAWESFWFGRVSARPLGAFRILFGLTCLLNLLLLAADSDEWLTDAGYLQGQEARELAGGLRPSPLQWLQAPPSVRLFLAAVMAVAVLFTLGWRTRLMALLLYLGNLSIHHRNLLTCSGADVLLVCVSFYMMLAPCGAAYSLDARRIARLRGTLAEPLIVPWAQRLIQIQVSLLYFMTAFLKATGTTWPDGTALHYVLGNTEFRRWTFGLTNYPLAINVLTLGALAIEFALPFLLWFRASRPYAIAAGIALHGGIALTVNIPIFGELLMASYLTFLTAPELDTVLRVLDVRRLFRRTAARPGTGPARPPSILRGPHSPVRGTTRKSGGAGR
jgi:hypothetical protein